MTKTPFTGHGERATQLLELVHTDVCGPMATQARGGYSYFITFTDDLSRFGYVYLMKYKSEAFDKFKEYRAEVEKQTGKSIKTLRSDRGGEYLSREFLDYLKECGIVSEWTPPGTSQHNGVAERRNRTLLDMMRSMLSFTDLPISFWGYALETSIYLLNKVPTKSVSRTPYEIWKGKRPSLKHLKIWGCPAYVKMQDTDKLGARSEKYRFVGYPKESLGYYFYSSVEQKVFVSRHATFLEKEFAQDSGSGRNVELDEVLNSPSVSHRLTEEQQVAPKPIHLPQPSKPPCRSMRMRKAPQKLNLAIENDPSSNVMDVDDPQTYDEAINSFDSNK
jgi:transposase InsO family protein